ncbi:MAG: hypothetical protein OHK0029_11660 [Armatimonadaceae bacterium]
MNHFRTLSTSLAVLALSAFSLTLLPVSPAQAQDANAAKKQQPPPSPSQLIFERAIAATKAKKYAEAERLYKELLTMEPKAAAVWGNLGLLVGSQGRIADAERFLEKAVELEPKVPDFRLQLAVVQIKAKKYTLAEANTRMVLDKDPKNQTALAGYAEALLRQEKYAPAVGPLQTLHQLEGDKPNSQNEMALIFALQKIGQVPEALDVARKRARRMPTDVNSQLLWGDMARMSGKLDEAEQAYQVAKKLAPDNPGAAQGLFLVAGMRGNVDSALSQLLPRLEKEPENAPLHFQAGFLLFTDKQQPEKERMPRAEKYLARAAALEPKNPTYITYHGLSLALQGAEKFSTADRLFRAALSLNPDFPLAHQGLAYIYQQTNRFKEAASEYSLILAKEPKNRDARRGLAGAYYASGDKEKAYQELETLAFQNPDERLYLAELASWQVNDGRWDLAEKTYEKLVRRDPRDTVSWIGLAQVHLHEKREPEAIACYRSALSADPKYAPAALLLGDLLTRNDKADEAIGVYRRFLNVEPQNNPVRWQLTLTLRQIKQFDEAMAEAQKLTLQDSDPNRIEYRLVIPRLLLDKNQTDEAIAELKRLEQEEPQAVPVKLMLAGVYEQQKKTELADAVIEEVVRQQKAQTNPQPTIFAAIGDYYMRQFRWEEAAQVFEEALRRKPFVPTAFERLTRVYTQLNQPEKAVGFLESVALSEPRYPDTALVKAIEDAHQAAKTIPAYRDFTSRLLERHPTDRNARLTRARSLVETEPTAENRKEAVELLKLALVQNAFDAPTHLLLAQQYEALGDRTEAVKAYRVVLRLDSGNQAAQEALTRLQPAKQNPKPDTKPGKQP